MTPPDGAPNCPLCSGFGWVPEHGPEDWYHSDWRLMLDPAVTWQPCPRCQREAPMARLQRSLARVLIGRLERLVMAWHETGGWRHARLPSGQHLWRWRDIACIAPGDGDTGWVLVSDLGIMRDLGHGQCTYHARQAGAPELPDIG